MRRVATLVLLFLACPGPAALGSEPVARPAGLDAEQWSVVQRGMGELDDAALRSLVWLDADAVFELRLSRLRETGLWRPALAALPQDLRAKYEQISAALGADPFARLDTIIVSARGLRGPGEGEELDFDQLQILARGPRWPLDRHGPRAVGRVVGGDR
jgi:hypothetical protein